MCFFKKKKKVEEVKPVEEKKAPETKPETVKEDVKVEKKPKQVKAPAPKDESKKESTRVYHVTKREEDGKWAVKFTGGKKVIKLFDTQKEALEYTKKMTENQDGAMLVHNSKGANKGRIKKK